MAAVKIVNQRLYCPFSTDRQRSYTKWQLFGNNLPNRASLLPELAIVLWRHANIFIKGAVKAAAGVEARRQRNIKNGFIGIA